MADNRKYYVICANNCKFEGMTKEQILTAISQAVGTGSIQDVDTGFVTRLVEQNKGVALYFWVGTQAEYNAIEEKADDCFYIITDDTAKADIEAAIAAVSDRVEIIENRKFGAVLYTSNAYANEGDTIEFDASKYTLFAITLKTMTSSCVIFCGKANNTAGQSYKLNGNNVVFSSDKTPIYFGVSIKLGSDNTHEIEVARYGTSADYSEAGKVMIAEIKGIM